ncbi:hypothetical protein ACLB2K_016361 [Fragaria x ananassa]
MKANTTHEAHLPSTGHRRLATKALMGIRTPDLLVREDSAFHPTVSTHQAHLPSTGHRRLATKALMGIRTPDLLVREDSAFHPTVSPQF